MIGFAVEKQATMQTKIQGDKSHGENIMQEELWEEFNVSGDYISGGRCLQLQ